MHCHADVSLQGAATRLIVLVQLPAKPRPQNKSKAVTLTSHLEKVVQTGMISEAVPGDVSKYILFFLSILTQHHVT